MKKSGKVGIFYLLVVGFILFAVIYSESLVSNQVKGYGLNALLEDIEEQSIASVVIKQNKEVPTGSVVVKKKDGASRSFNVTDVKEVQQKLEEVAPGIYTVSSVKSGGTLTTLMPYIFALLIFVIVMSFLSSQLG